MGPRSDPARLRLPETTPAGDPQDQAMAAGGSPHGHDGFMALALAQARKAMAAGEVPVGAVVVAGGRVVSRAGNRMERDADPTAHAEVLAIRKALARSGGKRLPQAALYVTLEPCAMCAGAIVLCRVAEVVFGARDPKAGALGSVLDFPLSGRLNHVPRVRGGVDAGEAGALLTTFFSALRSRGRPAHL